MDSLFDTPMFNARLFFPRGDESEPPARAEDLFVEVPGASLHLRWHRRLPAAPTVLLFHGNGEVVSDYDRSAVEFAAAGANLAVVDYRGYGASTGTPTLRSAIEDSAAVLAAIVAAGAAPLFVMGRSLGAACAAELYRIAGAEVAGFIWESGFVELGGLIRRRGMVPPASLSDDDVDVFGAEGKLRAGRHPLLVLHGAEDDMIDPGEAQLAFDAAGAGAGDKRLVLVSGRGHNDISASGDYWTALKDFIALIASTPR
jgi:alpha-beta hydrolase superfamily lysophospholipase